MFPIFVAVRFCRFVRFGRLRLLFCICIRYEYRALRLLYRLGSDMVFFVVSQLFLSPSIGLVYGFLHAFGDSVGIHDYSSIEVSCGSSYGLCQRCERRKPSLSASSMATNETSGKSNPSRKRLTPISTS